jgi:hypothetical protein
MIPNIKGKPKFLSSAVAGEVIANSDSNVNNKLFMIFVSPLKINLTITIIA